MLLAKQWGYVTQRNAFTQRPHELERLVRPDRCTLLLRTSDAANGFASTLTR